jgi:hypothetical protein
VHTTYRGLYTLNYATIAALYTPHCGKSLQLKLFRQFHHFVSIPLAAITSKQRWCIVLILALISASVIVSQALRTAALSLCDYRCTSGSISCKISFSRFQISSIGDRSGENGGQKIGTRFQVAIRARVAAALCPRPPSY